MRRSVLVYRWITCTCVLRTAKGNMRAQPLSDFHPALAQTWLTAASNKMLQPHHVAPNSRKLAWWCCPSCKHQFNKRIDLHVATGGQCPSCKAKPSVSGRSGCSSQTKEGIVHRCRPNSSKPTLTAENSNRIKKSVADGEYLRVSDTRNLLPMLAKNYEKEAKKIAADEIIYVNCVFTALRTHAGMTAAAIQILCRWCGVYATLSSSSSYTFVCF